MEDMTCSIHVCGLFDVIWTNELSPNIKQLVIGLASEFTEIAVLDGMFHMTDLE